MVLCPAKRRLSPCALFSWVVGQVTWLHFLENQGRCREFKIGKTWGPEKNNFLYEMMNFNTKSHQRRTVLSEKWRLLSLVYLKVEISYQWVTYISPLILLIFLIFPWIFWYLFGSCDILLLSKREEARLCSSLFDIIRFQIC